MPTQADVHLAHAFMEALRVEFDRPDTHFVRTWVSGEVVDHGRRSVQVSIRFTAEDGRTVHASSWTARDIRAIASPATVDELADICFSGDIDEPMLVHHVDADGVHWLGAE